MAAGRASDRHHAESPVSEHASYMCEYMIIERALCGDVNPRRRTTSSVRIKNFAITVKPRNAFLKYTMAWLAL